MQRAAATAATKEPQTPGSDNNNSPNSKRPKLSTEAASPGTPQSDLDAISEALKAEEQKRRDAIMRQAAEAGESEWVLDIPAANVSPPQPYAVAADSLDVEDDAEVGGRRAFGNFTRKQKSVRLRAIGIEFIANTLQSQSAQAAQSSSADEDSDDDEDEEMVNPVGPDEVQAMLNKQKAKALAKAARQREKEREKARKAQPVNLKHLDKISGGGGPQGRRSSSGTPSKKNKKKKRKSS